MPNHSGPGSTSITVAHMSAPAVKNETCSSACTAWWRSAASQKYGTCQSRGYRPEREGDERVRQEAERRTARTESSGRRIGPVEPGDDAERGEVAEEQVLHHVEGERLLLTELRDGRDERDRDQRDAEPEEEVAPPGDRRALRAASWPASSTARAQDDGHELERLEGPRGSCGMREEPGECRPGERIDSSEVEGKTYEDAGVSLALADSVVDRLRAAVESTGTEGFGAFAGLYPLDERRLLAATIDGAGTKLVLARKAGRLRESAPTSPRTA